MEREEITYPLGNSDFLRVLTNSFKEFIEKGTSRSTAKLKPLHGAIARDLAEKLGRDYTVFSQGYGIGKETKIRGRYVNKAVDIGRLLQLIMPKNMLLFLKMMLVFIFIHLTKL